MYAPPASAAAAAATAVDPPMTHPSAGNHRVREESEEEEERTTTSVTCESPLQPRAKKAKSSDEEASDAASAPSAVRLSPAQRCCKDQLHLTLSFLPMRAVVAAAHSCGEWLSAASSAPSLEWRVDCFCGLDTRALASSRLRHHVAQLQGGEWYGEERPHCFSVEELDALHTLANLRRLSLMLRLPLSVDAEASSSFTLRLPPRLEQLYLSLDESCMQDESRKAAMQQRLLTCIGTCSQLRQLHLSPLHFSNPDLSFLASLPRLTDLSVLGLRLTDAHLDALRQLPLQRLSIGLHDWSVAQLQRLLQTPCRLQLRQLDLRQTDLTRAELELFAPLFDSLEQLKPFSLSADCHELLPRFTRLEELSVFPAEAELHLPSLLPQLLLCAALRNLSLDAAHFASGQLRALLTGVPLLTSLRLLSCRFHAPDEFAHLSRHLTSLELHRCNLPSAMLQQLHGHPALTRLTLVRAFDSELDDATRASLEPPSSLFPALRTCNLREFY